jgi:hypothetical protein
VGLFARETTYSVLCVGGFQLAVSHTAPTGELLTSPVADGDGKGQPSQVLNQYGVGVDCHSNFFQICLLIPNRLEIQKVESASRQLRSGGRAQIAWNDRAS